MLSARSSSQTAAAVARDFYPAASRPQPFARIVWQGQLIWTAPGFYQVQARSGGSLYGLWEIIKPNQPPSPLEESAWQRDRQFLDDFEEFANVVNWWFADEHVGSPWRVQELADTTLGLDRYDYWPSYGRRYEIYHNQVRLGTLEIRGYLRNGDCRMLKKRKYIWLALLVAVRIWILYVAWNSSSFQECIAGKQSQQSEEQSKEYLSKLPRLLIMQARIGTDCFFVFLYDSRDAIVAVATAVIAIFTLTLWWATRGLLMHGREVDRAYIWGGGTHDRRNPNSFVLTVNNYGKTPGLLTEFAIGFCPSTDVPATPQYIIRERYHDWIPPIPEMIRPIRFVEVPPIADLLIYGRFWFQDIWGAAHSIGFVLVTGRDHEGVLFSTGIIPRDVLERIGPDYTSWDQTRRKDQ